MMTIKKFCNRHRQVSILGLTIFLIFSCKQVRQEDAQNKDISLLKEWYLQYRFPFSSETKLAEDLELLIYTTTNNGTISADEIDSYVEIFKDGFDTYEDAKSYAIAKQGTDYTQHLNVYKINNYGRLTHYTITSPIKIVGFEIGNNGVKFSECNVVGAESRWPGPRYRPCN